MELRFEQTGIAETLKRLDPKNVQRAQHRWFREGTELVRGVMRSNHPRTKHGRLKMKISIKLDPTFPAGWALVGSTHPLAHIFEGGTGQTGAPGLRHNEHFPRVDGPGGLMETTGLPKPKAFAMALTISQQGGLYPKPFVAPTHGQTRGQLIALAERIVAEELK